MMARVASHGFWIRWVALAVPATLFVVLTRSGAEPSDRTYVLSFFPVLAALFWVSYPVFSRFLQIEPTRMTKKEFGLDLLAAGAVVVAVQRDGLPLVVRVVFAVVGAVALAFFSGVLRQRERDGDVAKDFFAD